MAFNAMKATLVEYEDKGGNIILPGDIIINNGASKATPVTSKVMAESTNISNEKTTDDLYTVEFAEKYCKDLKCKADSNDLKQPTDKWTYKSNEIGTYAIAADKIVVMNDKNKTLYDAVIGSTFADYAESDLMGYVQSKQDPTTAFVNGDSKVAATDAAAAVITALKNTNLTKGDVVYIYEDGNGAVDTIVVARYSYAKIDSVATNVTTTEKNNGAAYRLKLIDINGNNIGTYYDSYDDSAKNTLPGFNAGSYEEDVTLAVAKNGNKIVDSYVIEAVNGKPTAAKTEANGYITVDGTKYNYAGTPSGNYNSIDFTKNYAVYATKEGYVIAIDGVSAASLEDVYYVTSMYYDTIGGENVFYAQRVSLDGKAETVKVEEGSLVTELLNNQAVTVGTNVKNDIANDTSTGFAGLYTFNDDAVDASDPAPKQKSDDGILSFKKLSNDADIKADYVFSASKETYTGPIEKDDSSVTLSTSGKKYIGAETKFLVVGDLGSKIDVTAAVGGINTATSGYDLYYIADKDDSSTAMVVIVADKTGAVSPSAGGKDMVYLADTSKDQTGKYTYTATLYDMTKNESIDATITTDGGQNKQGFFSYEITDGNYKLKAYTGGKLADSTYTATDKGEGYVENLVINSVYEKNGVTMISGTVGNVTLTDAKLVGATIIDNRGSSDIDASVYNQTITTTTDLKDAVAAGKTVTADIYYDDGVTFIAIDSVATGYKVTHGTVTANGLTISAPVVNAEIAGGATVDVTFTGTATAAKTMQIKTGDKVLVEFNVTASQAGNAITGVSFNMPEADTALTLVVK